MAGISRPLAQIIPSPHDDVVEKTSDVSKRGDVKDNLYKLANSVLKDARTGGEDTIDTPSVQDTSPTKQDDECVEETNPVINVDELSSGDELIKSVNPGIVKRPRTRKGKVVLNTNLPKINKKKVVVGPPKYWSKVSVSSKKRKPRPVTEYDNNVDSDVQDIMQVKKYVVKRSSMSGGSKKKKVTPDPESEDDVGRDVQDTM